MTYTNQINPSPACPSSFPVSVDLQTGRGPASTVTQWGATPDDSSWNDAPAGSPYVLTPPDWFMLKWDSINAQTCSWSPPFNGAFSINIPVATSSNFNNPHVMFAPGDTRYPSATGTTYTINCTSPSGATTSDSVTVRSNANIPPPPSTKFSVNQQIHVLGSNVNTRATPSLSGTVVGQHQDGDPGNVLEFSVAANGYIWWHLDFISGADGWVAENYLQ